jgi:hypothetical protein
VVNTFITQYKTPSGVPAGYHEERQGSPLTHTKRKPHNYSQSGTDRPPPCATILHAPSRIFDIQLFPFHTSLHTVQPSHFRPSPHLTTFHLCTICSFNHYSSSIISTWPYHLNTFLYILYPILTSMPHIFVSKYILMFTPHIALIHLISITYIRLLLAPPVVRTSLP